MAKLNPEGDEDIERYLEERKKERDHVEIKESEKTDAWALSAMIMGIWTFIHLMFLINSIGTTSTVYQEMVMANTAIVFTLSLIATLFFVCKALE